MLPMRTVPFMTMMLVVRLTTGGTLTRFHIVLETEDFLMMMMRQDRSGQHYHADYH